MNLAATGPTNLGPGERSDLHTAAIRTKWTKLAHTLKARFYLHTARGDVQARTRRRSPKRGSASRIRRTTSTPSSPATRDEAELLVPVRRRAAPRLPPAGPAVRRLLQIANDPRLAQYFNCRPARDLSDYAALAAELHAAARHGERGPAASGPESAQRTGNDAARSPKLNAERAHWPVCRRERGAHGHALLTEILTEKYIADFQSIEAWNDYKRTCSPNLTPSGAGRKIPARFPYDIAERNTNINIPPAERAADAQCERSAERDVGRDGRCLPGTVSIGELHHCRSGR